MTLSDNQQAVPTKKCLRTSILKTIITLLPAAASNSDRHRRSHPDCRAIACAGCHGAEGVSTNLPGPSPYISHYLCMIGQICGEACWLFCRRSRPWRLETRECLNDIRPGKLRSGLGGPGGDAGWVKRCGDACQAGEARALAAAARRLAAPPQASAVGHADAIATLMRRILTRTRAPILSSLRRMVPQVALANGV